MSKETLNAFINYSNETNNPLYIESLGEGIDGLSICGFKIVIRSFMEFNDIWINLHEKTLKEKIIAET